jgi:hypothetical protein
MNESVVRNLAKHVRETIEINKDYKKDLIMNIAAFPSGCCFKSSWVLWKHLRRNWIGEFNYVEVDWTYRHKPYNHVWLENDTHVLDITGDQFNGWWKGKTFDKVILIPKSEYFFSPNNHIKRWHYSYQLGDVDNFEKNKVFFLNPKATDFNIREFYNRFF